MTEMTKDPTEIVCACVRACVRVCVCVCVHQIWEGWFLLGLHVYSFRISERRLLLIRCPYQMTQWSPVSQWQPTAFPSTRRHLSPETSPSPETPPSPWRVCGRMGAHHRQRDWQRMVMNSALTVSGTTMTQNVAVYVRLITSSSTRSAMTAAWSLARQQGQHTIKALCCSSNVS